MQGEYFMQVNKKLFGMGLTPIEILVLAQIMELQDRGNGCYMTDEQFAENFGVSAKTISRSLKKLEELGLAKRHTHFEDKKNVRTITQKL